VPNHVWIKQGVMGTLQSVARKGFGRVAKLYFYHNMDFFCTSIQEGTHSPGSFHYDGTSFDFLKQALSMDLIRDALGEGWDVIDEHTHVHAEYDPK